MNKIKLVFVSCSALLLSVPSASAEEKGTKKLQEISKEAPTNIRSSQASLAGVKERSLSAPSRAKARTAVREETIISRKTNRTTRSKRVKPLNPYQAAFQALKVKANLINPSLGGRVKVSFTIDRNGKATKILLFGFDAEMDEALTAVLAQQQFPTADSGQYYSSKLSIIATQKPPAIAPRARRARKAKKPRRR